ncbi:MAG: O-antigen ligase family protein [Bacteroidota bacterium]|nr:O-antigen ligase family protein [Bacteroidota bacterium]
MRSLLPEKYHYYVYIFALVLLVVGLPLSKFLMSLSQIILAVNWLLEGNLKSKFKFFFKNKPALILSSLLLLHFVGLLWTSDFGYAASDIRIKAPLFVLPLILCTSKPLTRKSFDMVLQLFVVAIIIASAISTLILSDVIHREVVDIRKISIFISHIRFSLLICMAVFISGFYFMKAAAGWKRIAWSLVIAWLLIFLALMESLTGIMTLGFCVFILCIYQITHSENKWLKIGGPVFLLCSLVVVFLYIRGIAKEALVQPRLDVSSLERVTAKGNRYSQSMVNMQSENGNYVWVNYNMDEMEESWNKRSEIKFLERDLKSNEIRFTLVRFLASKGWKKDGEAVEKLSAEEINAIQRGVVNVKFQNVSSLRGRIHEVCWEIDQYRKNGIPNGHSITQRFEYWKTAGRIIRDNFLIGVGTGDVQKAFEEQYEKDHSRLLKEWRLRAHNQYLTFAVTFGIFGFLLFVWTLIFPVIRKKVRTNYLYICFFLIAVVSFLTEDTLETQAGVTFFAFFNSFLLFVQPDLRKRR